MHKKWITPTLLVENILIVSYKTKQAVTTWSSNCTLGQLSQKIKTYILSLYKNLYMNIHGSFIHNCPKLKTTQMSFSGWMIINSGTSIRWNTTQHKKKQLMNTCKNLDGSQGNRCCCLVANLCPTLYNSMDCCAPGFPVLHYVPELAQTHVHWVSDAIQPSHPLLPSSPPAFNLSQHQGHFWGN